MLYYASKISPNMARTPEGYLICQNVPIARTGQQEYLASELPLPYENPNEKIMVYRRAEDVFSHAALASFEGKPVTDEHPSEPLTPTNVRSYIKGIATNVRRGTGENADKMLADLVIYDALLIAEIESGKREVSCGYDCQPTVEGDRIFQKHIEGNHIAVVSAGRAGSSVAIKDTRPVIERKSSQNHERRTKMGAAKRRKTSDRGIVGVLANLWPKFTTDADPDDLTEVVEELVDVIKEEVEEAHAAAMKVDEAPVGDEAKKDEAATTTDESAETLKKIYEILEKMEDVVEEMKDAAAKKDNDPLAKLEKLEEELSVDGDLGEPDGEEEYAEPPEDINEDITGDEGVADEEGVIMPPEGRPENPLMKDAALKELRRMKPIVAAIKDPKQRKAMADSMANLLRTTYGLPATGKRRASNYSGILEAQRRQAARKTQDSKKPPVTEQDIDTLGDKIAESHFRRGKQ